MFSCTIEGENIQAINCLLESMSEMVVSSRNSACSEWVEAVTLVEKWCSGLNSTKLPIPMNSNDKVRFSTLPKELQLSILSFLPKPELLRLSQVSHEWRQLAFDGMLWVHVDVTDFHEFISTQQLTKILKSAGSFVKFMNLRGCYAVTNQVIQTQIQYNSNLEIVNLSGCRRLLSSHIEQLIIKSPHLKTLDLSGLYATTYHVLDSIAINCFKLNSLNLAFCKHITDESIRGIVKNCRFLTKLNLNGCTSLRTPTLKLIGKLPNLSSLAISRCSQLVDYDLISLAEHGLSKLEKLDASYINELTESGLLAIVKQRPPLKWVNVSGCTQISESGFYSACDYWNQLKFLGTESCPNISDRILRKFGTHLPNLTHLTIGNSALITDSGFYALLRGCTHLTRLEIDSIPNITDAILRSLYTWIPNQLTNLEVHDCQNLTRGALADLKTNHKSLHLKSFFTKLQSSSSYQQNTPSNCNIL